MNEINQLMEQQFSELIGTDIDTLLNNIDEDSPCGPYLKYNGVYSSINAARSADDPSTPMGEWEHDLNTADWDEVSKIAVDALAHKTKDLQLAIWLLEAQINQNGFAAIGPCFHLLNRLSETFWDGMHPEIQDDDIEYRTNLIAWVNEKLQPVIKQLAITLTRSDQIFSWADWEMAAHLEQLPPEQKKELGNDFIQINSIVSAVIATPIEFYRQLFNDLKIGIQAVDEYSALLDKLCKEEAPSLLGIRQLLQDIYDTLYSHVKHRGLEMAPAETENNSDTAEVLADQPAGSGGSSGPIRNRTDAYAQLAEAAEYLAHDDPHSPVPYLIYKAIEWGQLNTAELYQELFVQYQGQLNIFEILGLDLDAKPKK